MACSCGMTTDVALRQCQQWKMRWAHPHPERQKAKARSAPGHSLCFEGSARLQQELLRDMGQRQCCLSSAIGRIYRVPRQIVAQTALKNPSEDPVTTAVVSMFSLRPACTPPRLEDRPRCRRTRTARCREKACFMPSPRATPLVTTTTHFCPVLIRQTGSGTPCRVSSTPAVVKTMFWWKMFLIHMKTR